MGLRGIKPDAAVEERRRLTWRMFLTARALGYRTTDQIYSDIAETIGVSKSTVDHTILGTSPVGCFPWRRVDVE